MNTKAASERYQRQVQELSKQVGNANCADCGGRYPRWASWSLGIFLCVNCAGVHRKMGTHISKVKSLTLDTWTKEQVERMREIGNVKSNAKYNPDERRNRPPANVEEGERNSELERYIFDKYKGRFMDVRPPPVPMKDAPRISPNPTGNEVGNQQRRRLTDSATRSADTASSQNRSATAPFPSSWSDAKRAVTPSALPSATSANSSPVSSLAPPQANVPPRSSSASLQLSRGPSSSGKATVSTTSTNGQAAAAATTTTTTTTSVFDDLLSVQNGGPVPPSLAPPLQMMQPNQQMNPWAHLATQQQAIVSPMVMSHVSPFFQQQHGGGGVMGSSTGHLQGASLGAMAFGQQQQQGAPFMSPSDQAHIYIQQSNNGFSPQVMGQQAFSGGGGGNFMPSSSPYGQHIPSSYLKQPSPQPIQQQVPVANSNPFGTFATSMMPAGQQQQYGGGGGGGGGGGRGGMWN